MPKTPRQQAIDDEAARTEARGEPGRRDQSPTAAERAAHDVRRGRFAIGEFRLRRDSSVFDQPTPKYVDPQLKAQQDKELRENERIAEEIAAFSEQIKVKYSLTEDQTVGPGTGGFGTTDR